MTTLREAAQMALKALQESKPIDIDDPAAFYRSAHAIEALRAALANEFNPDWDAMAVMVEEQQRMAKRIEELESALAQPEQEELGEIIPADEEQLNRIAKLVKPEPQGGYRWREGDVPPSMTYTAPPQREWQGMTDDEITRLRHLYDPTAHWSLFEFARAIETKLKEKNT